MCATVPMYDGVCSVTVFCVRLTVHVLCQCFNVNGELVLNYSITDAWG